jgi:PPK2 family polyphosphate:nucleotide phosphotransferase
MARRPHHAHVIDGSNKVKLDRFDPRDTAGLAKERALALMEPLGAELAELSNLLSYAGRHALLVIMQGRDASGKDGAIRRVLQFGNVLNSIVRPFKAPTTIELGHDFLWRVHRVTPRKGETALFNRSHYEDVIAVRVHDLVPPDVWKGRYEQINDFERLLQASGTIVLKFYLHISREEQYTRLLEREQDPRTAWKLNVNDWREVPLWDETTRAYEDVLERCSSRKLPWFLIPADKKWFRNLAVIEQIVLALRPYKAQWLSELRERRRVALKEIRKIRKAIEPKLHER